MKKQNFSLRYIAKTMNRDTSTISRELKRNTGKVGYRHKQAHELACRRHAETIYRLALKDKAVGGLLRTRR